MKTLFLVTLLSLTGCAGLDQRIGYDMALVKVEAKPSIESSDADPTTNYQLIYSDKFIHARFKFGYTNLRLTLSNKTDSSIKVKWDDAAWITPSGESLRIIHSGIRFLERNAAQPSTIVARHGKIEDTIAPSEYAYFVSGSYGGWRQHALFHETNFDASDMDQELEAAQSFQGKTCGLLLPIEINGAQREYMFTFKIGEAMIVER